MANHLLYWTQGMTQATQPIVTSPSQSSQDKEVKGETAGADSVPVTQEDIRFWIKDQLELLADDIVDNLEILPSQERIACRQWVRDNML